LFLASNLETSWTLHVRGKNPFVSLSPVKKILETGFYFLF